MNGHANPYYRYDPNGSLTCMSSSSATYSSCTSAIRTVTYTAFNMAAQIVEGSNTYAFSYDSEHARIKQVAPQLTTLYLNAMGAMSEQLVGASSTTWRDYIMADGHMVAQRDKVVSTGTVTWSYFITDHLGSIAVITDASGAVTERLSYDAWGKRRNANGTDANCGTIASSATRGFTGHEMLDGLCLVNMNARIYDPDLGRFMSADSMVGDASNLQDWNAYTYVNNNPLSFTDPTGHIGSSDSGGEIIELVVVTPGYCCDSFGPSFGIPSMPSMSALFMPTFSYNSGYSALASNSSAQSALPRRANAKTTTTENLEKSAAEGTVQKNSRPTVDVDVGPEDADAAQKAAQAFRNRIDALDKKNQDLKDGDIVSVDGKLTTGAEIKNRWRNFRFVLTSETFPGQRAGAVSCENGQCVSRMNVQRALQYAQFGYGGAYASAAVASINSIIFHEIGHTLDAASRNEMALWAAHGSTVVGWDGSPEFREIERVANQMSRAFLQFVGEPYDRDAKYGF